MADRGSRACRAEPAPPTGLGRARPPPGRDNALRTDTSILLIFVYSCPLLLGAMASVRSVVKGVRAMSTNTNRGLVYLGPGKVAVQAIPYPKLELAEQRRKCEHGVILKVGGPTASRWEGVSRALRAHALVRS